MSTPTSTSTPASAPASSSTSATPTPHPSVTPLQSDLSHPSVQIISIKEGYWGTEPVLDKIADNWHSWSNHIWRVLQLSSGLDRHLDGTAYEPDPALEPRANTNYSINDTAVRAYIYTKCATPELEFIENCPSAISMWTTLKGRHELQGPISQVTLIQEALLVRYSLTTPFSDMTTKLRDLNRRIWDMGAPTAEKFLCILMLLALSPPELRGIRDSVANGLSTSTSANPFGPSNIIARLDTEQQIIAADVTKSTVVPAEALVARSSGSRCSSSVCTNCKRTGHEVEYCVRVGGGDGW